MGAGSSPAESEAKLLLLPTRSAEKLAKELASSAKERVTLDRTAKKARRDPTTEWLGARVIPMVNETVDKRNEAAWQTVEQTKSAYGNQGKSSSCHHKQADDAQEPTTSHKGRQQGL